MERDSLNNIKERSVSESQKAGAKAPATSDERKTITPKLSTLKRIRDLLRKEFDAAHWATAGEWIDLMEDIGEIEEAELMNLNLMHD